MPVMRVCAHPRCTQVIDLATASATRGRCPIHYKTDNQRRARKAKAHGTTTAYWRKLRAQALERDKHICTIQARGCQFRANTVHISPHLGGNHLAATLDDCKSACRRCHGRIDGARSHTRRGATSP
jgi:5-methylcytosine-specific restriction endonuclease McrA